MHPLSAVNSSIGIITVMTFAGPYSLINCDEYLDSGYVDIKPGQNRNKINLGGQGRHLWRHRRLIYYQAIERKVCLSTKSIFHRSNFQDMEALFL